jgi:hypothetical protein
MFRCFSLLGIVAVAFGVAALASVSPTPATKTPENKDKTLRRPPQPTTLARIPGLKYHLAFSMN